MKSNQATLGVRDGCSKKSSEFDLNLKFSALIERFGAQNRPGCIGKVHTGRENKHSQQYPQRNPISCMCRVQGGLELHFVSRQSHCEKLEAHFATRRGNGARSRAGAQGTSRGSPEQEVPKVPHSYPWLHHSHPSWAGLLENPSLCSSGCVSLDLAAHHSMLPLSSPHLSPTLTSHHETVRVRKQFELKHSFHIT